MKTIFFGSDDFAQVHLEALIKSPHEIEACVTPPDKPKGRGMKVVPTPVKETALEHNIKVLQPQDANDKAFFEELKAFDADLFVVIAYGRILSKELLAMPKTMPINVHSSLLPKYRGAAPINWAIINGEEKSGISIIKMNEKMDAGDIIAQKEIAIDDEDTSVTLREKMKNVGPKFLVETIDNVGAQCAVLLRQDPKQATFAPKLTKEMGKIDWGQPAAEIHNLIRGLQPWPGAFTTFKGKNLKILSAKKRAVANEVSPGEIIDVNKNGFVVAAKRGALLIKDVHLESAKRMHAASFVRGHQLEKGERLGS